MTKKTLKLNVSTNAEWPVKFTQVNKSIINVEVWLEDKTDYSHCINLEQEGKLWMACVLTDELLLDAADLSQIALMLYQLNDKK